jgi:hypothetical protein
MYCKMSVSDQFFSRVFLCAGGFSGCPAGSVIMNLREAIVDSLGLSLTNAALLVRGFFAKMGFFADFLYIPLISP